jgi:FtsH-binding integral membrane protein
VYEYKQYGLVLLVLVKYIGWLLLLTQNQFQPPVFQVLLIVNVPNFIVMSPGTLTAE